MRMLEGELWEYNGVVYIAKGFQHPEGMIVAYPRYDLYISGKIPGWRLERYIDTVDWECIKSRVPVIPVSKSTVFLNRLNNIQQVVAGIISDALGVRENDIYVTGSSRILGKYNDIDIAIYGVKEDFTKDLENLVNRGVLKRVDEWVLVDEYWEKHRGGISLAEYLWFKKNTLLHLNILGIHVNLRPVIYSRGVHGCIDPVLNISEYTGLVRVIEPIIDHAIPSRYIGLLDNGEEVILESMREVYSELDTGNYLAINNKVEERPSGIYLVPDHGLLKPILRH
ncbi:hypothetical protein Desfe_0382 [Desulfurococcus amylolyticus DSM 16532]|uniref:Uncharacterized protein n=2 Tax=Desulfurococcus amylolyticus TaxID=94694 RepID=I3XQR8_DESAM|nr:hypothetical protein Desfe_0382 [Desulfurococcus amylolyticus DSM 16532]